MTKSEIVTWVQTEFLPLTLATPAAVIQQQYDNAVRYFNTHSGFKIIKMFNIASLDGAIDLDTEFKSVVKVYPSTQLEWIYKNNPLWTLTGIQIINNMTQDLIVLGEAFKNYRMYIGTDFKWKYIKSDVPTTAGKLLYNAAPSGTTKIAVTGTKRIVDDEDITSEYLLNFILYYTKALVKMIEGNTLRKTDLVGANNDGQRLVEEGDKEKTELQQALARDGRWVALVTRG